MYRGLRVLCATACLDEESKVRGICERIPTELVDRFLLFDDGSTDRTAEVARAAGATVISNAPDRGLGPIIRKIVAHAQQEEFDVVVFMAGNGKDDPQEISRLLGPIADGCDFVQGSRFLPGGGLGGDMPRYRKWATRFHPWLVSKLTGVAITESTNGFRAFRTKVFSDPRIRLDQAWLANYEMEPYLLYKMLTLGFRTAEVPVHKIYPPRAVGNTKMRPGIDWLRLLLPVLLLRLGIRN